MLWVVVTSGEILSTIHSCIFVHQYLERGMKMGKVKTVVIVTTLMAGSFIAGWKTYEHVSNKMWEQVLRDRRDWRRTVHYPSYTERKGHY